MQHYWQPLYKRFSAIYWLSLVKNGFPTENGYFLMEVIQRIGTIWWFSHLSQFRQISSELWKTQPNTILWNTSDHLITLFNFFLWLEVLLHKSGVFTSITPFYGTLYFHMIFFKFSDISIQLAKVNTLESSYSVWTFATWHEILRNLKSSRGR